MKYILLGIIRLYRLTLSKILPRCCRFYPSCSEYGMTAIRRFGAVKGGYLAFWRIFRCNPFGNCGYDPVPDKFCFRPEKNTVSKTSWDADDLPDISDFADARKALAERRR